MKKYLITIEFIYDRKSKYEDDSTCVSRKITLGISDTFKEACKIGNDALIKLESKFSIHTYPDGRKAKIERFSENGGCFGSKKALVTNLAYLKTPFAFFVKISTLEYTASLEDDIGKIIKDIKG